MKYTSATPSSSSKSSTQGHTRTKHTHETPWRVSGPNILDDTDEVIAHVFDYANACLIAAAPDLLKALSNLLDHAMETYPHFESERGQRDIKLAIDARNKAKGE